MIQLKSNKIPRGLVSLEDLFDRSNAFKGTNKSSLDDQVDEVDIGNKDTPRIIKVGKGCTSKEKKKIVKMVKEYCNVPDSARLRNTANMCVKLIVCSI
jgi:uncharacterized protein YajQ (UPF0234 family)